MARPERFELPTFWFVAEFHPLYPTTPTNQTQRNNKRSLQVFPSFWPVSVALHGQKTDRGETRKKERPLQNGRFPISGICKHPTWSAFMLAVASRDCLSE